MSHEVIRSVRTTEFPTLLSDLSYSTTTNLGSVRKIRECLFNQSLSENKQSFDTIRVMSFLDVIVWPSSPHTVNHTLKRRDSQNVKKIMAAENAEKSACATLFASKYYELGDEDCQDHDDVLSPLDLACATSY